MSASSLPPATECPVCFVEFSSEESESPHAGPCLHNICRPCFNDLDKKICPQSYCKQPIPVVKKNYELLEEIEKKTSLLSGSLLQTTARKNLLESAIEKAVNFLANEWPLQSTDPNRLTARDLDILWAEQQHFAEQVFAKIYQRLCDIPSYRCVILENFKVKGTINKVNYLCELVARPKAVEAGNPVAQYCYAHCLFYGINIPKDIKEALKFYQNAAAQGLALAIHQVGVIHCEGYGVKIDAKFGVKQFKKADTQNCLASITELGKCYLAGNGVRRDIERGIDRLELAAHLGDIEAMITLGDYYSKKEKNYLGADTLNVEAAKMWYQKAIERGSEKTQKDLERCLLLESQPQKSCIQQ